MPKPILIAITIVCFIALCYSEAKRSELQGKLDDNCREPVKEWATKAIQTYSIVKDYENSLKRCIAINDEYLSNRAYKTKKVVKVK